MRLRRGTHGVSYHVRRSFVGGYRMHDVELVLESLRGQLDAIAVSLERVWSDRERLTQELAVARAEAVAAHERTAAAERAAAARAEEIEAEARARAAAIVADADEQAARLRHAAAARVGDAATRLEDLLRVREQLLGELRGFLHAYGDLLEQIEERPSSAAVAEPVGATAPAARGAPAATTRVSLFPRRVELDAGPFADFAELAAFERSLARLPKVEDVHVRRFGGERAAIELTLAEERPLVHDLTAHLPYRMDVTSADEQRLTVDVRPAAAEA